MMKLHFWPTNSLIGFPNLRIASQLSGSEVKLCGEEFVLRLLDRRWALDNPSTKIHKIMLSIKQMTQRSELFGNVRFSIDVNPKLGDAVREQKCKNPSFYIVRDDLLHPLVNGNKPRKLDALLPLIEDCSGTDVSHILGKERPCNIVIDAGTGTTAVGFALGVLLLRLPWKVTAVMLADTFDGYKAQERRLISDFKRYYKFDLINHALKNELVHWVNRGTPRKFGNVLDEEVKACQQVANQTGVFIDPIYTLAAWELAVHLSQKEPEDDGAQVVMLHTGGTLGMFGLAQRYKSCFRMLKGRPTP